MGKKINNQILVIGILFLLVVPLSSAGDDVVIRQDIATQLNRACFVNGTFCGNSATTFFCNFTMTRPDGIVIKNNLPMQDRDSFYNISLNISDVSERGSHPGIMSCTDGAVHGEDTFNIIITGTGFILSTSQALIYVLVLALSLVLFGMALIGAIRIKWTHPRNSEGKIINMNNLRYVKLFLWFMNYVILIWITFLMWNITDGFLNFNVASAFFQVVFKALLGFMFPIIAITFVTMVINLVLDKKLRKKISRGARFRGV